MTDFVAWLESRRKFAKLMMELAIVNKDKKDEHYYLGRMHEAKLIKHHLTKKETVKSTKFSLRVKKGWETRRKNQEVAELAAKNEEFPPYPAGPTQ